MKVLVLGGTGAMGVYLVDYLAENKDNQVVVTSRSSHVSTMENVQYIQGNARDNTFVENLLQNKYDIVVDFMNYNMDEFASRYVRLLSSTNQYIWFSSSRVYAYSSEPLSEKSPRLLEVTNDHDFLSTNRYALRKARQEDMLQCSGFHNYTIIRPYITYSDDRLQLGIYEKEQWLYRLLQGRSLVVNKNILNKKTTLTFGKDVSYAISKLVGNENALGITVQIATSETMLWGDIIKLYIDIIKEETSLTPRLLSCGSMLKVDELYEGGYNTVYDREWDRSFNSVLVNQLIEENVQYTKIKEGLTLCLQSFLRGQRQFRAIDWDFEAYQDVLSGEYTPKNEFPNDEAYQLYSSIRGKFALSDVIGTGGSQIEMMDFNKE